MAEPKTIAFLAYPGVTPLDLVGPLTVLRDLRIGSPIRTLVVAADRTLLPTDTDLRLQAGATYAERPAPFGLIVPGGGHATLAAMADTALLAYVRSAAASAEIVGATGNGALVLAAAGLLDGRRAAIHWAYGDLLRDLGATPVTDRVLWDGRFVTAAGGTAGIDAMLELAARLTRPSRARLAQLSMEYDPAPPFGRLVADDRDPRLARALRAGEPGLPR